MAKARRVDRTAEDAKASAESQWNRTLIDIENNRINAIQIVSAMEALDNADKWWMKVCRENRERKSFAEETYKGETSPQRMQDNTFNMN